jgi:hypothetical protein
MQMDRVDRMRKANSVRIEEAINGFIVHIGCVGPIVGFTWAEVSHELNMYYAGEETSLMKKILEWYEIREKRQRAEVSQDQARTWRVNMQSGNAECCGDGGVVPVPPETWTPPPEVECTER